MDLGGKSVLVTGAAKRVGKQIALAFAAKGANILLHYHSSEQEATQTAEEIRSLGVACDLFRADLSQSKDIRRMLKEILARTAVPDVLVNSASLFFKTPVDTMGESDFDRLIAVNLKAPFLLSQSLGVRMKQAGGGRIVNIADWSGFRPYKEYAPYCASKGGLLTLTRALARDLAPNVLVNAVAPGPVLLPEEFSQAESESIARLTALGRIGTPQDVAFAAVELAENDYLNGTVLVVDGGRSIL